MAPLALDPVNNLEGVQCVYSSAVIRLFDLGTPLSLFSMAAGGARRLKSLVLSVDAISLGRDPLMIVPQLVNQGVRVCRVSLKLAWEVPEIIIACMAVVSTQGVQTDI